MKMKEKGINNTPNAAAEEAYNMLRTNIQFCGFDKDIKTITVTSTNPGEGKTTTAINMGMSLARAGMKVLLVDADMRTPVINKEIDCINTIGLSNLLSGRSEIKDTVEKTNTDNLYIIKSGIKPPNPTELLSSSHFMLFIKEAREAYDMVIFDTPPMGSVIDAALIAAHTDGTLLVVKAKSTNYRSIQRVKGQLEKANAKLLGTVLNKMKKREYSQYFEYYDYYKAGVAKANAKKMLTIKNNQKKIEKSAV